MVSTRVSVVLGQQTDKTNFDAGFYGRIDKTKWFHTTVTNVEPTAKQSWVLNPYVSNDAHTEDIER